VIPKPIPANIKKFRLQRNLTQAALAAACGGRDVTQLNAYENGRSTPTPRVLKEIADALGVTVADLTADGSTPLVEQTRETFLRRVRELADEMGISGVYVSIPL